LTTDQAGQRVDQAKERHAAELAELLRAVLGSPGITDVRTRQAIFRGDELSSPLAEYLSKVDGRSYRIMDSDITALQSAGYSEDAIFEVTVIAALGTAARQLDAGLRAMREAV
jgi:hypothetical protein